MIDYLNIASTKILTLSTIQVDVPNPGNSAQRISADVQPNPFSDVTRIRFSLNQMEPVELLICSLEGKQIRTLIRPQRLPSGDHTIFWDGITDTGTHANSGVYYYLLKAGNRYGSGKIVLVK